MKRRESSMPVFNNLDNLVVKDKDAFYDAELNLQAYKDMTYLITQSGLGSVPNLRHITVSNSTESYIADIVAMGATTKDAMVKFPKGVIKREDKAYIGVVLYNEGQVADVFLFPVSEIKGKKGLFSIYKDLKNEDAFGIKMSKAKKLAQYRFRAVLHDYVK